MSSLKEEVFENSAKQYQSINGQCTSFCLQSPTHTIDNDVDQVGEISNQIVHFLVADTNRQGFVERRRAEKFGKAGNFDGGDIIAQIVGIICGKIHN